MARKRANSKRETAAQGKAIPIIMPLQQRETMYFSELVELSNLYAKLRKQHEQYVFVLGKLKEQRTDIQKGNIKLPILMPLGGKAFYSETDKKKVLEEMDDQINSLKESIKGIKGQMDHRRDDYIEAGLRLKEFATTRFGVYKPKQIMADRKTAKAEENTIFEGEFDKIFGADAKPEVKKEYEAAVKTAVKANEKAAK